MNVVTQTEFPGGLVQINERKNRIEILFTEQIGPAKVKKLQDNSFWFDKVAKVWHREYTNYTKFLVNHILDTKIFN